jgi:glutaconyl-CoA/methylmalonyl-CoA decarboxylase subunit gamma
MRYFITLNGQEHQLELSRGADGATVILAPSVEGGQEAEPLGVEILTHAPDGSAVVKVGARIFRIALDATTAARRAGEDLGLRIDGVSVRARIDSELERKSTRAAGAAGAKAAQVRAPLPGRLVKLNVKVGDRVALGGPLLTIEAMKMENEIVAPRAGRITRVLVEPGAAVDADAELLSIEEE